MINDDLGQLLHQKATEGQDLSIEELTLLAKWYERKDQEEAKLLGLLENETPVEDLQGQIESVLAQLVNITKRLKQVSTENEVLRGENEMLREKALAFS